MSKKLLADARGALENGRFAEARDAVKTYAQDNDISLQHYLVWGLSEIGLADWKNAEQTFSAAVERFHANNELWAYLGLAQQALYKFKEAAVSFEQSLKLYPGNGVAASNLANIYRAFDRFEEAEKMGRLGVKTHPDRTWALNTLGIILGERGKYEEARKIYEEALAIEPTNHNAYYNLGNLHAGQKRFEEAWPCFHRAQEIGNEIKMFVGEGLARLLAGDYEKGWQTNEARLRYKNGGMHGKLVGKRYAGEDLTGCTIAVMGEQGFGDNLHFCRFAPLLEKKGAELIWSVQKPLQRLFAHSFPGQVFSATEELPQADYHVAMMSLPLATGCITPETWPKPPYLKAPSGPVLPPATKPGPRIGLVWAGSMGHENDHHRSMPIEALEPLFSGITGNFYAAFIGPPLKEITDQPITKLDHLIKDFGDTAALMKQMDVIITVDSGPGHLAGALNIPTYMCLPFIPEWRWGFNDSKTPWYPSMTIVRQRSMGDWNSVMQQLILLFNEKLRH